MALIRIGLPQPVMAVLAADVDEALKVMLRGSNTQKIVGIRLRTEEETNQFRPPRTNQFRPLRQLAVS